MKFCFCFVRCDFRDKNGDQIGFIYRVSRVVFISPDDQWKNRCRRRQNGTSFFSTCFFHAFFLFSGFSSTQIDRTLDENATREKIPSTDSTTADTDETNVPAVLYDWSCSFSSLCSSLMRSFLDYSIDDVQSYWIVFFSLSLSDAGNRWTAAFDLKQIKISPFFKFYFSSRLEENFQKKKLFQPEDRRKTFRFLLSKKKKFWSNKPCRTNRITATLFFFSPHVIYLSVQFDNRPKLE